MELEKIASEIQNIRDGPLSDSLQNEAYHFACRQEQIYRKQKPHITTHPLSQKILAAEGIIYLIGTGSMDILSPTYRYEFITPTNGNIDFLRAQSPMYFVDPTLKAIQKMIQPKEVPLTYKEMMVDVFSDNKLRQIWKLGKEKFKYEAIFAQRTNSGRLVAPGVLRGKDLTSSSRRKALSE
jgi:hypothetical protein